MKDMIKKMIVFKMFVSILFIVPSVVFGMEDGSQHYDSIVSKDGIYVVHFNFEGWRRLDTEGFAEDIVFSITQGAMQSEDKTYKINKRYNNCYLQQLKNGAWCIQNKDKSIMAKLNCTDDQFKRLRTLRLKTCIAMVDNQGNLLLAEEIVFLGEHKLADYDLDPIDKNIKFSAQDNKKQFRLTSQDLNTDFTDVTSGKLNFDSNIFRTFLFYGGTFICVLMVVYYFIKLK
jgi:hypothetical protein